MADKKIEDATLAESIAGTDVVPAAVGENPAPRKVKFDTIKNFTLAAIKDIAGLGEGETISADTDFVLTKRAVTDGFEEKHVGFDDIAKAVSENLFAKGSVVSATDIVAFTVGTEDGPKTVSLTNLAEYIRNIFADNEYKFGIDIDGLTEVEELSITDAIPIHVDGETGNKKTSLDEIESAIISSIPGRSPDISGEILNTDRIMLSRNGDPKQVLLQNSGLTKGGAKAPVNTDTGAISTVTGNIPQWADNSGNLSNGLDVVSSVGPASGTGAATDSNVPTEKAVRTAINAIDVSGKVNKPSSNSADYIPQWNGNDSGTLKNGKQVATSISAYATASDDKIPTEKAVRYSLDAKVEKPNSNHDGYIPQWYGSNSGELSDGKCVTESLASQESASNDNIPTEKAVRDAMTNALTSVAKVYTYSTVVSQLSELPPTGFGFGALIIFPFLISGVRNYGIAMNTNGGGSVTWQFVAKLSDTLPTE